MGKIILRKLCIEVIMSLWNALTGNVDQSKMSNTFNKGMGQYMEGMRGNANTLSGQAGQMLDFNSGLNVAQRNQLQNAAADSSAMGGMQAQRIAAQQGMGGSGLLQQAQNNQTYKNMMGANQAGLGAFLKQQQLAGNFLSSANRALQGAGEMQSDINVSNANVMQDNASRTANMLQKIGGEAASFILPI